MPSIKPTKAALPNLGKSVWEETFTPSQRQIEGFPIPSTHPPKGGVGSWEDLSLTKAVVDNTTIGALALLRERLTAGYEWLQARQDKPASLREGAELLESLIVRDYLPGINAFRARLTEPELEDMLALYAARVSHAWNHVEAETHGLFVSRLTEYQVAEDIRNGALLATLLDRVREWAGSR